MPFTKRIAEVEEEIEARLAEIVKARAEIAKRAWNQRERRAELEKLLSGLARLKAEELRLLQRQRMAVRQGPRSQ